MKRIALFLILCIGLASVEAQEQTLPAGLTQEQYDAISKQLPEGVTLEMVIANLPQGMTLQQALEMMAAQQQAKAEAAAEAAKASEPHGKGGWQFLPYAAVNLGMTSSLGCPHETRQICASDYNFNFAVGALVAKRFGNSWGMLTGLAIERKGSNSNVIMKDYFTKVKFEGQENETQGYFSGRSQGWHDVYYITAPLNAMYQPKDKWEIHFGPYVGYAFHKDRHGLSSEGTIRQSLLSPVVPVENSESDNSKTVSDFDWGLQFGMTHQMWRQLYVLFDFSWGLWNVWDGSDYGMDKPIYNIYAKLGFGWRFETGKKK